MIARHTTRHPSNRPATVDAQARRSAVAGVRARDDCDFAPLLPQFSTPDMSSIRLQRGVLLTSDEPTIVFIAWLSERAAVGGAGGAFVLRKLDSTRLLVRADALPQVQARLRERLLATTFEEDEE